MKEEAAVKWKSRYMYALPLKRPYPEANEHQAVSQLAGSMHVRNCRPSEATRRAERRGQDDAACTSTAISSAESQLH